MVVLDTDHLSLLEWLDRADTIRLRERLWTVSPDVFTTIINYEEQVRGWMGFLSRAKKMTQQIEAYRRLQRQLENLCAAKILPFDEKSATVYQSLRQAQLRVETMDLKIAAITLAHDATLLIRNAVDFGRVPGLKMEDWTV
jgi:tRNA(fMet)-specific endonuclease VapC